MTYLTYVGGQITEAHVIQPFSRFVFKKCLNLNSLPIRDDCDGAMFVGSENSCAQSFVPS